MRLQLMLACLAIAPGSCEQGVPAAKSLHPLVSDSAASCEPGLAGAWRPDTATPDSVIWILYQESAADSGCALTLVLTDTFLARVVLDTLEMTYLMGIFLKDSAAAAAAVGDKRLLKQYRKDLKRWDAMEAAADTSVTEWDVLFARRAGGLFVDLTKSAHEDLLNSEGIRTHWFLQVISDGDQLALRPFSRVWLQSQIDSAKIDLSHARTDEGIVLTASGEEVLAVMERFAADTQAFPGRGSIRLRRWPVPTP